MNNSQRIISSYLQMKRKRFWVIRYVEIYSDNKLYYYYNKGDNQPRSIFDLEQSEISEKIQKNGNSDNIIIIHTGREVVQLMAESQKEHETWLQLLKRCSQGAQQNDEVIKKIQQKYKNSTGNNNKDNLQKKLRNQHPSDDVGSDHDFDAQNYIPKVEKPFIYDKQVIQQRFQGDDQLMLKANTSFFISEYKDLVLTKVEEGMKVFMCKMGKIQEKSNKNNTKSPEKEIRTYIITFLNSMKNSLGIPLFCLVTVTIFILFFIIFYMLFEVFNTSSLILSFLACLNVFILPYVFLQAKKKKKAIENQFFRLKVQMAFPANLNHFLFAIQQLEDRIKWHPNIRKQTIQKDIVSLQLTDFDNVTQEYFQMTIYSEHQYLYIIEHQKSHILRVFQLNYQECSYNSFDLIYYGKVCGPKFNQIQPFNNENLLKGLAQYINDQKVLNLSPLNKYIGEQNKAEQEQLDIQERNFSINRNTFIQFARKTTNKGSIIKEEEPNNNNNASQRESMKNSNLDKSQVHELNLDDSQIISDQKVQRQNVMIEERNSVNNIVQEATQQEPQQQVSQNLSPEQQKFVDVINAGMAEMDKDILLVDENKWDLQDSKKTWTFHMRDQGGKLSLRAADSFNCSAKFLGDYLEDQDNRYKYDDMYAGGEFYEELAPNVKLLRNEVKGMMVVSGRDFLMISSRVEKGNKIFIIGKGATQFDEKYPPKKKIVRGEIFVAGWVIESTGENTCTGTFMACTDPKGNLGTGVKKIALGKQANTVKKLKSIIDKMAEKKNI